MSMIASLNRTQVAAESGYYKDTMFLIILISKILPIISIL